MKYFRDQGMICGIVERWIPNPKHPGGGFRSDFLNIIDMIFLGPDGIVGVQSCGQDFIGHQKKILFERKDELIAWLEAGGKFVIIGWRKLKKKRGGTQMVWTPRILEITLANVEKLEEELNEN
jgi:hypothetical protein